MSNVSVCEAMHRGVVSCSQDLSLREAARLMTDAGVRALVVMDERCALTGIISQTDLVNVTLEHPDVLKRDELTVKDVMTPEVLTVTPDMSLAQAAKLMVDHHVHRLVVVEDAHEPCKPTGVLSMGDVVRALMNA